MDCLALITFVAPSGMWGVLVSISLICAVLYWCGIFVEVVCCILMLVAAVLVIFTFNLVVDMPPKDLPWFIASIATYLPIPWLYYCLRSIERANAQRD